MSQAQRLAQEDGLLKLVDVTIGSFPEATTLSIIRIDLLCTQDSIEDRPMMSSALLMLSNSSVTMLSEINAKILRVIFIVF